MHEIMNNVVDFWKQIFFRCIDFVLPAGDIETMEPEVFASRATKSSHPENQPAFINTLFSYRDPMVRRAIWELKYRGNKRIASVLGTCLYKEMLKKRVGESESGQMSIVIIPIPSSRKRFREKGFNQTYLLADAVKKLDQEKIFSINTSLLQKRKETKTQVSIRNRQKRLENLKGAFGIDESENIRGATCFLIDDVTTTGATLFEARETLLKAGAKKVLAFTLAH
ncbi:MAG: phosphoribosyltransferase family protein [Candidatus Pacebacteria bacterium]|nr:phosphoribosyltransferase family protein [Candidatus Paceibacterota bacterium]